MGEHTRYVLFGRHPLGGGWDDYFAEFSTLEEARHAALYWLDRGYDAHLIDTVTDEQSELRYRYDGLGTA